MIKILKSKIHGAVVTDKNLMYEGSIGIDKRIMKEAEIVPYEFVLVINLNNGKRFETYAIEGKKGEISLQGGTARLGECGDRLLILSYEWKEKREVKNPKILLLNGKNEIQKSI